MINLILDSQILISMYLIMVTVAIASEPVCLVGVDIVSYDVPQGETTTEFIQFFSSYFSSLEWDNIVNSGTLNDVLTEFYRYDVFILYLLSRNS